MIMKQGLLLKDYQDQILKGHDSHGIARVPRYVEWMERGWFVSKHET